MKYKLEMSWCRKYMHLTESKKRGRGEKNKCPLKTFVCIKIWLVGIIWIFYPNNGLKPK